MSKAPQKAVIPCAGLGTRFLPVTKSVPKELLPIGRKPAIHYVVEELAQMHVREIILVCHRSKVSIADYFARDESLTDFLKQKEREKELAEIDRLEGLASIQVVYQETPRGLGDAIRRAQPLTGSEAFLVVLPDDLIFPVEKASLHLAEVCRQRGGWGVLLEKIPQEKVSSYGIIRGREIEPGLIQIEGAVEKPSPSKAPSDLAIIGRYLFPSDIYSCLSEDKGSGGEIQLTDAIDRLAKLKPGWGILCQGNRFDVGIPEGLLEATRFVMGR